MPARTLRLLHVDDDEDDRFFLVRAANATALPIVVSSAASGEAALRILQAAIAWPDLLLLDIRMPLMNGFEFMEKLRDLGGAKCPVVMYSNSARQIDVERARAAGAQSYCIKPEGLQQLTELVKRLYEAWLRSEIPCEWPLRPGDSRK